MSQVDDVFADPELARLYDHFNAWAACDDFYLEQALAQGGPVLDLGCGTGMLASRIASEGLQVFGADPALAMLRVARSRPGGERVIWLQVTVTDRDGKVIFKSGDLDPNGDVRDQESAYVHNGELPLDRQLFNLQSRFVHTNVRGGERLQIIPIPFTITALPIVRPSIQSLILTGEPLTERNHRKGIEPLGHRWAKYTIDSDALTGKGPYEANVRLMIAPIPVNLIGAVQSVGFDYGMSAREIADAVVAGHEVLWEKTIAIEIKK